MALKTIAFHTVLVYNLVCGSEGKLVAETNAHVIILYSTEQDAFPLIEEVLLQNVTGKTWIATSNWITSKRYITSRYAHILQGTIGFVQALSKIPGLYEFLVKVKPQHQWSTMNTIYHDDNQVNNTLQYFWKIKFI